MEGMSLKLIRVVVRRLLGCSDKFGPITDISWIHSSPNAPKGGYNPPPAVHPPPPPTPPLPPASYNVPSVILQAL